MAHGTCQSFPIQKKTHQLGRHGQLKAWREPMPSAMLRYIQLGCWRNPRDSEQSVTSTHASSWEQSQVGTSLGDVENPRWMSPLAEENIKVSRCCQVNKKELGNCSVVNSHGMNDRRSKFKHEWYRAYHNISAPLNASVLFCHPFCQGSVGVQNSVT